MTTQRRCFEFLFVSWLTGTVLLACTPIISVLAAKPVVSISSPAHGADVNLGQEGLVQASAADPSGIVRVELWVDGAFVTLSQPSSPQTSYAAILRWTPAVSGSHTLTVTAVNANGISSDPAAITVEVTSRSAPAAPPTLIAARPALTVPPTSISASPAPATTTPSATSTPFIPPTPTLIPKPNEYVTVAQLNLWFHGPGCYGGFEAYDCSGKRNTGLTPALGSTYDSASMAVIRQQIEWATAYGVDAFSIEWTTPREVPGSIENILDDNFLQAPDLVKMRWCLFYDLVLRLQQTPGLKVDLSGGMDFNNPDVYNTFVADFGRFAEKYFSQPQYLKIDGRPVVYVWGTWNATGRYVQAFQEARRKAASLGYDVYLVGDVVLKDSFSSNLASVYDADTNAWFFTPDSLPTSKDMGDAAAQLDKILTQWEKRIAGLRVAGRQEEVILQPGFTPQEDNRVFNQVNHAPSSIYVPALSKDQVTAMAKVVRKHAHPAGSQNLKLIWLNTWNNWPETTTLEPTAAQGPKYPAGNYQFDLVQVVRDVFGAEVFSK